MGEPPRKKQKIDNDGQWFYQRWYNAAVDGIYHIWNGSQPCHRDATQNSHNGDNTSIEPLSLDERLRAAVKTKDIIKVKELIALGASPAFANGHGTTFYNSILYFDKEIFDTLFNHQDTGCALNDSRGWPCFEMAMVAYRPYAARKIMNHRDCDKIHNGMYTLDHTSAPWQFQSFVFREIGAEKHPLSEDRWNDMEIQQSIKDVAKEWFDKHKLNPPKLYYEKFVFCKLLTKEQIKQFVSKLKIDEHTVLPFPIIDLIIEMAGIKLTKQIAAVTGFKPDLENYKEYATMLWLASNNNPLKKIDDKDHKII